MLVSAGSRGSEIDEARGIKLIGQSLIVVAAAAATLTGSGIANAARSYQGADFSQDSNFNRTITACDEESDNHGVRADVIINGIPNHNYKVADHNGAHNACISTTTIDGRTIYKHRIVEEVNAGLDYKGHYVFAG